MPRRTQANNKTQSHDASVEAYLADVANAGRREDAFTLLNMMCEITGEPARMWGSTIIGFGSYHYVYATGREGDHCLTGFAPRKANMVVYIMPGFKPYADLLSELGKYKTGSSCLYLGRLKNIDIDVLGRIVERSVQDMRAKYTTSSVDG